MKSKIKMFTILTIVLLVSVMFIGLYVPTVYATTRITRVQGPIENPVNFTSYNQNGYDYSLNSIYYTAYLKAHSNWGDGVQFTANGGSITYQPSDYSYRDVYGSQDYISSITDVVGAVSGNIINYTNCYQNVTLQYVAISDTLKENYIITQLPRAPAGYLINATLDFGGYIKYSNASIYVNGTLMTGNFITSSEVDFKNAAGQIVFWLPAPIAYDSKGNYTACKYEVNIQSGQIWFYIRTPYSWLQTAVFPVYVDPITRVQGNARGTAMVSATVTVTMASTPTSGNLLVCAFGSTQSSGSGGTGVYDIVSSIAETGVTWTKQVNSTYKPEDMDSEVWVGVVGSGASKTITITTSLAKYATADICEYSGLATSGFLDLTSIASGSGTSTITGNTTTTSQDVELWIGCVAGYIYAQATPKYSFTLLDGASSGPMSTAYLEKNVTSAGTAGSGTTLSTTNYWAGCIATFKAAAAGDTTKPTYSSISTSVTVQGQSCNFGVTWTDETGLATTGGYIFGCNVTGTFTNETWTAFTANPQTISTAKTLSSGIGDKDQYEWWANDTSNNWNNTGIQTLTVTQYAFTATCSYSFTFGSHASFSILAAYFSAPTKSFTLGKSYAVTASYFSATSKTFTFSKSSPVTANYFATLTKSFSLSKSMSLTVAYFVSLTKTFTFTKSVGIVASYFASISKTFTFGKSISVVMSVASAFFASIGYAFTFGRSITVLSHYTASLSYVFSFGHSIVTQASYLANIVYNFRWFQMITQPFQLGAGAGGFAVALIAIIGVGILIIVPFAAIMLTRRRHK